MYAKVFKMNPNHDPKSGRFASSAGGSSAGTEDAAMAARAAAYLEADTKYSISDARYSKGNKLVQAPGHDGFMTRAGRVAEGMGGKYTNREKGYVMSARAAERYAKALSEGWDYSNISGKWSDKDGKDGLPAGVRAKKSSLEADLGMK